MAVGLGIPVTYHAVSDVVETHHSWISGGAVETPLHGCWSETTVAHGGTVTGHVFSKTISILVFKKYYYFFGLCICVYVRMNADTRRKQKRASDPLRPELQAVWG